MCVAHCALKRFSVCVCERRPVSAAASFRSRFHGKLPSPQLQHDMPYNPHMTTGSLVLCSLLGRGHGKKVTRAFHDTGSRFSHLQDAVSAMAGATKVGFNNTVFLALKQRSLKVATPRNRAGSAVNTSLHL
jgi:hypothetical protein